MSTFTEVSIVTDGEAAEAVAEALRPFAYQNSVVLEQLGDQDNPDPRALEDRVTVKIFIPEDQDTPALRRRLEEIRYHLNRLYPVPPLKFSALPETDWANAWKDNFHPFQIGERIWIIPSWVDDQELAQYRQTPAGSEAIDITLDPGMAFGTGTHPTTKKCLMALEQCVQKGDSVLDVGTGSGILAIAAAQLGATKITGVDTDHLAVKTAVANSTQNNVQEKISLFQGELKAVLESDWDVVIVNILAPVIIDLLKNHNLLSYLNENGTLILSGIIDEQLADVEKALVEAGGIVSERKAIRDWVTVIAHMHKPGS